MKTLLAIVMLLATAAASAGPAPWYQYRSKLDNTIVCSQTPLGDGWERLNIPYRDSRCEKPKLAK